MSDRFGKAAPWLQKGVRVAGWTSLTLLLLLLGSELLPKSCGGGTAIPKDQKNFSSHLGEVAAIPLSLDKPIVVSATPFPFVLELPSRCGFQYCEIGFSFVDKEASSRNREFVNITLDDGTVIKDTPFTKFRVKGSIRNAKGILHPAYRRFSLDGNATNYKILVSSTPSQQAH